MSHCLFRCTTSILDMEMLCCEVSKIESGLAVQAGLAKKPRKNYFNVENEWSLEWLASFRGKYGQAPGNKFVSWMFEMEYDEDEMYAGDKNGPVFREGYVSVK